VFLWCYVSGIKYVAPWFLYILYKFLTFLCFCFFVIYRMIMVRAVKWVDDIIPDAPYAITEEFMNKLFTEYNIDYIIHGDDPCLLPDGTDAYALAKKAGRYKQIKRTEGVSTTDIVGTSSALVFFFSVFYVKLCFANNDIEV